MIARIRHLLHAATCISCGAAYGTGHYSWCDFDSVSAP